MHKLILLMILFTFASFAGAASATTGFSEVLSGCNQLTHAEWIKRYNEVENKVIETLEKNPKLSQATEKELLEVVFPQDLPKSHPMKGAFVGCFEHFNDYHKAKNNVESLKALKRMESCYRDAYKVDPPKVLGQYLECLKKVKY